MVSPGEWRWLTFWGLALVSILIIPYLVALVLTPPGLLYTGLLINPQDGASYLAKMRQGADGQWLFRLPYTSEPHTGVYLYLFYLLLGHLARLTGLSLPLVYHLARLLATAFLWLMAYRLCAWASDNLQIRRLAWLLIVLSSGFGWLVTPLGLMTADLWVPEAITFYAALTNPHFPLAMALLAALFLMVAEPSVKGLAARHLALITITSLALILLQPFCALTVAGVLGVYLVALGWQQRRIPWPELARTALTGVAVLPVVAYDVWALTKNPVLAVWTAQNQTPSPPLWDYALSYGLIGLLALLGTAVALRRRSRADLLLLAWAWTTVALVYLPVGLQRRLTLGWHLPLAVLAAFGLTAIPSPEPLRRLVRAAAIALSSLTNLLVIIVALAGVWQHDPYLYVSQDEMTAFQWLTRHTQPADIVLAAPRTALFIPVYAGNRVWYGHPFETIGAAQKRAQVEAFFAREMDIPTRLRFLTEAGVRFVFYGPAEQGLGLAPDDLGLPQAASFGQVTIYQVQHNQGANIGH